MIPAVEVGYVLPLDLFQKDFTSHKGVNVHEKSNFREISNVKICEIHPQQEEQIVLTVEPMLTKLHLRHK